jgi:hypothetical protein
MQESCHGNGICIPVRGFSWGIERGARVRIQYSIKHTKHM